jgi:hypothetical protein
VASVPTVQSTSSAFTAGDGQALRSALGRTRAPSGYADGRWRHSLRVFPADLPALLAKVGPGRITVLVLTMQAPPGAAKEAVAGTGDVGNTEPVKKLPVVRLRATECSEAETPSQSVLCVDNGTLTETGRAER